MFTLYAALTALLALNRETGGILVVLYGVVLFERTLRHLARFGVLLGIYAGVQISLHLALGNAPHVMGLSGTFQHNLDTWQDAAYEALILLPLLALVIRGYRTAPTLHRRLLWVAGLYLVAIAVGGAWNEIQRLILPLVPLLLPTIVNKD